MKLWDKGISIDKKIEQFTVGNDRDIDAHIAKYDVIASKAHAKMLQKIGILTADELKQLLGGLEVLASQIEDGSFVIDAQFEDVHSKIEFELTKSLGEVGKKIHTARSRNDQVLVALQLYYKEQLSLVKAKAKTLFDTLLNLAETHKDKVLPGYTHLQVAMPSSFGLWFSAYAEILVDDVYLLNTVKMLQDCFDSVKIHKDPDVVPDLSIVYLFCQGFSGDPGPEFETYYKSAPIFNADYIQNMIDDIDKIYKVINITIIKHSKSPLKKLKKSLE